MSHFKPDLWFRTVPLQGGHLSPFLFYLMNHVAFAAINFAFTLMIYALFMRRSGPSDLEYIRMLLSMAAIPVVMTFAAGIVGLYVKSAVYYVSALLAGSRAPFERTLRVIAFASAPTVWCSVTWLFMVWVLVLYVIGFRRLHGLSAGRAAAAALLPAGAAFVLCVGGLVLALSAAL